MSSLVIEDVTGDGFYNKETKTLLKFISYNEIHNV